MSNTYEHILHLYDCIDELRNELSEIRQYNLINEQLRESQRLNPYTPLFTENEYINSTSVNRRTPSLTVERNNSRTTRRNRNNTLPRTNIRNRRSGRDESSERSERSESSERLDNVEIEGMSPIARNILNSLSLSESLVNQTNTSTPDSIEFTFFEPRISNVSQRLNTLIDRIQRNRPTSNRASASTGTATNTFTNLDLNRNMPQGLTLEEINNGCETSIYNGADDTCTICRGALNNQSVVRKIKNCGHVFHLTCLDTWFENHRTCPLCRGDVVLREQSSSTPATGNTVVNDLD